MKDGMYWRLHERVFDERIDEAVRVLRSAGDSVDVVSANFAVDVPQDIGDYPSVLMTSIEGARDSDGIGVPWLYYEEKKFQVSYWMSNIDKEHLLNDDTMFLPFGMLKKVGLSGELFVRPNSGNKIFVGAVVPSVNAGARLENYNNFSIDNDTMCAVSSAKNLPDHEFRFWIVDRKIATFSSYAHDGDADEAPSKKVIDFISDYIVECWQPDVAYVLDVVEVDGGVKIVELNATSTSGVYQADLEKLFSAIRVVAKREYNGESFV